MRCTNYCCILCCRSRFHKPSGDSSCAEYEYHNPEVYRLPEGPRVLKEGRHARGRGTVRRRACQTSRALCPTSRALCTTSCTPRTTIRSPVPERCARRPLACPARPVIRPGMLRDRALGQMALHFEPIVLHFEPIVLHFEPHDMAAHSCDLVGACDQLLALLNPMAAGHKRTHVVAGAPSAPSARVVDDAGPSVVRCNAFVRRVRYTIRSIGPSGRARRSSGRVA